ncbi:MAG TPA: polymer-forming cytoskeletal protein [Dehalococcoidia bacterium]|nr:polymer-forming cytoskeletal protein [Dehalococcoidia bacterium]
MNLLKEINKEESGQTFILVLILLLLGGLIIASLLGFMSTGLTVGRVYEERMDELYAADSGVEDALWHIKYKKLATLFVGYDPNDYDTEYHYPDSLEVNNKDVDVAIQNINEITYRIESTATSPDTGSSTTIESYIEILDMDFFLDNAITSRGAVGLGGGGEAESYVYDGDVVYCTGDRPPDDQVIAGPLGIDGEVINECVDFPSLQQMSAFYREQVKDETPYDDPTWDLKDDTNIGPLYRNGDLNIISTGNNTGVLQGTVFVKGNLNIGKTNQDFTLDLNMNTIFVEGVIINGEFIDGEIDIGGKCTITGTGCIIAWGDIYFSPKINSSPDQFVFIMSIKGTTTFNPGAPSSDFYGSIAGDIDVGLWPGKNLSWTHYPGDLNLPGFGDEPNIISSLHTWEISLA